MRAVDTNVLVRLITGDQAKQTEAAESFVGRGAWVPLLVLAETIWVLDSHYGFRRDRLITAVEIFLKHQHLSLQDAEVAACALEHFRGKAAVSFSDCLILEIARKAGHLPLGTFDRELGKLDGAEYLKAAG